MNQILKGDFYRLKKSKLFFGFVLVTMVLGFGLTMLNRQDIRLGISIFGDLTAFRKVEDIINIGMNYQKGLGIFVAIVICFFIGQEYQWNTWQHKWLINKSRTNIYLSKLILSIVVSVALFLLFEVVILLFSGRIGTLLTSKYIGSILCGSFVYAVLGSAICFISMLTKNLTSAVIISLFYILFSETLVSIIQNIKLGVLSNYMTWLVQHSAYGMSTIICSTPISWELGSTILLTSIISIIGISTIGVCIFRKYEI